MSPKENWENIFINTIHDCFNNENVLLDAFLEFVNIYKFFEEQDVPFKGFKTIGYMGHLIKYKPNYSARARRCLVDLFLPSENRDINWDFDYFKYRVIIEYAYNKANNLEKNYTPSIPSSPMQVRAGTPRDLDEATQLMDLSPWKILALPHIHNQRDFEQRKCRFESYVASDVAGVTEKNLYNGILSAIMRAKKNGDIKPADLPKLSKLLHILSLHTCKELVGIHRQNQAFKQQILIEGLNAELSKEIQDGINKLIRNDIHYDHANINPQKQRYHLFKATTARFANSKRASYFISQDLLKRLYGDELKAAIISEFKKSIEFVNTRKELDDAVARFKGSREYQILATGQGSITRLFRKETTSVKAVELVIADVCSKMPNLAALNAIELNSPQNS